MVDLSIITTTLNWIRKNVSHYFLNMLLLLVNTLIGFYTHSYSIMFSALVAITICTYLYDNDDCNIDMKQMDIIVLASILFPIGFLWFQHGHPTRVYAGLIILFAFTLYIINKIYIIQNAVSIFTGPLKKAVPILTGPSDLLGSTLSYLAGFGHIIFNIEWALLVLL